MLYVFRKHSYLNQGFPVIVNRQDDADAGTWSVELPDFETCTQEEQEEQVVVPQEHQLAAVKAVADEERSAWAAERAQLQERVNMLESRKLDLELQNEELKKHHMKELSESDEEKALLERDLASEMERRKQAEAQLEAAAADTEELSRVQLMHMEELSALEAERTLLEIKLEHADGQMASQRVATDGHIAAMWTRVAAKEDEMEALQEQLAKESEVQAALARELEEASKERDTLASEMNAMAKAREGEETRLKTRIKDLENQEQWLDAQLRDLLENHVNLAKHLEGAANDIVKFAGPGTPISPPAPTMAPAPEVAARQDEPIRRSKWTTRFLAAAGGAGVAAAIVGGCAARLLKN